MNKEIVFVGRMQNKTRNYIHNLEREVRLLEQENQQLKEQWDELRSWLEEEIRLLHPTRHWEVLDKLNELEELKGLEEGNHD